MDHGDREKSEFNMVVSYLNRLNVLFYVADESAMQLDVYTWFHSLQAIYRELSTEMKPKELEEWNGIIKYDSETGKETVEKKGRLHHINDEVSNFVSKENKIGKGIPSGLYNRLHNFEVFLRKILKDAGLQNRMAEDSRRALR